MTYFNKILNYVQVQLDVESWSMWITSFGLSFFGLRWQLIRHWLDICAADPHRILDHFIQFEQMSDNSKSLRSALDLI